MKIFNYSKKDMQDKLSARIETLTADEFKAQFKELLRMERNPAAIIKLLLFIIGAFFTAFSFAGMILGYVRGYNKFMRPKEELPRFTNLPLIVKIAMLLGVAFVWALVFLAIQVWFILGEIQPDFEKGAVVFFGANLLMSLFVYIAFRRWRYGVWSLLLEVDKNGTARFATPEDLEPYRGKNGLYIGGNYAFADKGHALLVCGTRGGKSQNVLMANVLRVANYEGSMVYIDPKGEAAAVCANYLRKSGKRVVILNPWDLLGDLLGPSTNYNPLSFLSDKSSEHLIDDVSLIAELIVPLTDDDKNKFFTDSARNLIAGLLLHLVTTDTVDDPDLGMLWQWLRLHGKKWDELLADMYESKDPVYGNAVKMAASEIAKQMGSAETFSSIISNALEATSFLKSHALQKSIGSGGFDPYSLTDGNTVVFVVLPFDKLLTYSNYMRLVVATLMRAVVRKPSKENKTTFIIDEAFNLGYMREFETALSGYAGYNISLWLVYQDLNQIMGTYGKKWESIMANATIRQFMSIRDVFSLEYISKMLGDKTRVTFKQNIFGTITEVKSSHRPLATPNEVMRMSQENMLLFTGENPAMVLPKLPYYQMPQLKDVNGNNLYDPNPYIENSL
ncbi:MAG TPA: type IV secretory system conjugative DNA transfer family protein [Daejeonella sp.]